MRLYKILPLLLLAALLSVPTQAEVSRFPNGLTNVGKTDLLGDLPLLDPTKVFVWFDDFNQYLASDWIVTTTETTTSATEILEDIQFSALIITNASADDDADFLQDDDECFKFVSGKQTWFTVRLKTENTTMSTQSDWFVGLQIRDTDPVGAAPTDGIWFRKDDGDLNLDFVVAKNGTATTTSAFDAIVANTYIELSFYYDGASSIEYYSDNVHLGTVATTNLCDDEELLVSFGVQNGQSGATADPSSLTLDYIFVAQER